MGTEKGFQASVSVWQGHEDLNPEPSVLETAALPIELYPYIIFHDVDPDSSHS